jgi:hypothetical protein
MVAVSHSVFACIGMRLWHLGALVLAIYDPLRPYRRGSAGAAIQPCVHVLGRESFCLSSDGCFTLRSATASASIKLRTIVGRRHVLTNPERTRRYRTGFRFGTGPARAVVRPGNLVEQWRALKACAAAGQDPPHQRRTSGDLPFRRHSLQLENALKPLGRVAHSIVGSS